MNTEFVTRVDGLSFTRVEKADSLKWVQTIGMVYIGSPLMHQKACMIRSPGKMSSIGFSLTNSYMLHAKPISEPIPLAQRDQRENNI